MKRRRNDKDNFPIPARSERVKYIEDGWYIITREQLTIGPYASKFDAEITSSLMVAQLKQAKDGRWVRSIIQQHAAELATRQATRQPSDTVVRPKAKGGLFSNARLSLNNLLRGAPASRR